MLQCGLSVRAGPELFGGTARRGIFRRDPPRRAGVHTHLFIKSVGTSQQGSDGSLGTFEAPCYSV